MTTITVTDAKTGEVLPGIPTPRLIQAGWGEAYFVPAESRPDLGGIWYLRDVGYASPTGEYRLVRIVVKESL